MQGVFNPNILIYHPPNSTEGLHFSAFHCSCPVCMCVCVCVCPLISAASHIGITQQRYQRVHRNTAIVLNFADFLKNASFKSYGVICLPRADPASYSFSPQKISFYASVKPIATFSLLRQRVCGRQRHRCQPSRFRRDSTAFLGYSSRYPALH